MTRHTKPRVFVVDDHPQLLSALERLLQVDCDVVGRATTIAGLMEKLDSERPDVLVVDFRLPDGNGIEACREVRAIWPDVAVIILTAMDHDEIGNAARDAGAARLVSKYNAQSELVPAILAASATREAAQSASTAGRG